MTISTAIALIVIADVALLAALAYVMSRVTKLTPHSSSDSALAPEIASAVSRAFERRPRRSSARPAAVNS